MKLPSLIHLLQEFHGGHRFRADEQEVGAARDPSASSDSAFGSAGPICRPAPDEAMHVHIGQAREFCVTRVHAPNMAPERHLPPTRNLGVVEVVIPLRVPTEGGVVDVRRQCQRGAAAPTADQFRGEQFPFVFGASIRVEESIEGADTRLILAHAHVGAIATEYVRLRHRQGNAGLTRRSKDELAGLDRPSLARQRRNAAAFDRRLVDAISVAERIEIARLRAEVLSVQNPDAREGLILVASDREDALPVFL
jgi:hypothetical protein